MTNKQWLATLDAETWWSVVHDWLFPVYGKQWTESRLAIMDWLEEEHEERTNEKDPSCAVSSVACIYPFSMLRV